MSTGIIYLGAPIAAASSHPVDPSTVVVISVIALLVGMIVNYGIFMLPAEGRHKAKTKRLNDLNEKQAKALQVEIDSLRESQERIRYAASTYKRLLPFVSDTVRELCVLDENLRFNHLSINTDAEMGFVTLLLADPDRDTVRLDVELGKESGVAILSYTFTETTPHQLRVHLQGDPFILNEDTRGEVTHFLNNLRQRRDNPSNAEATIPDAV